MFVSGGTAPGSRRRVTMPSRMEEAAPWAPFPFSLRAKYRLPACVKSRHTICGDMEAIHGIYEDASCHKLLIMISGLRVDEGGHL